jgi:hypothetical protein
MQKLKKKKKEEGIKESTKVTTCQTTVNIHMNAFYLLF